MTGAADECVLVWFKLFMYKHIKDKRRLLMFEFVLKLPLHRTAFTHFLADFSMHTNIKSPSTAIKWLCQRLSLSLESTYRCEVTRPLKSHCHCCWKYSQILGQTENNEPTNDPLVSAHQLQLKTKNQQPTESRKSVKCPSLNWLLVSSTVNS